MSLPPLTIPSAKRVPLELTGGPVSHGTSGYRDWVGQIVAPQPIVALVMNVTGAQVNWSRTSHRGATALETRILFAPYDSDARRIGVSFSILDATAVGETCVESRLVQPLPVVGKYETGTLLDVARVPGDPPCELKAVVLVRDDVESVRNGVWHASGNVASSLPEPWHRILTFGRSGTVEAALIKTA